MSESLTHKNLVIALFDEISNNQWPRAPFVYADVCGASIPPMIGSARPDVYARFIERNHVIVGEAKSSSDLDTVHTREQLEEYFSHIETTAGGELWVAVPWLSAGAAVRICATVKKRIGSPHPFRVSAWMFGERRLSKVWYG